MSYPLIKYQLNKQLKIKPFFLGGTIIQRPEKSIVFGESSVVDKYYMANIKHTYIYDYIKALIFWKPSYLIRL